MLEKQPLSVDGIVVDPVGDWGNADAALEENL